MTKTVFAVIGGLLLTVLLAVGGWQLGWWMNESGTNRRARINNDSYARQSALVDDVLDKHRTALDIDVQLATATPAQAAPLRAQRIAVVAQFCDSFGQIKPTVTVPASVASFASQECA